MKNIYTPIILLSWQKILFLLPMLLVTLSWSPIQAQSYTFTTCGQLGNAGPSQSQCDAEYTSTSLNGKVILNSGIQYWIVPSTGRYKVEAYGAQGSNATSSTGGLGAYVSGEFMLNQGDTIRILVGQNAPNTSGRENLSSSGGGGTFITKSPHNTNASILVIAGGGGGTGNERPYTSNATIFTYGQTGSHGTGGTGGNAGVSGTATAGAGGGFFTNGSGTAGGAAYINGGLGGITNTTYSVNGGGFGGGGSVTAGGNSRYGGGGGYSGGSGSNSLANATTGLWGGGGGSYNSGSNQQNDSNARMGHGLAIITALSSGAPNDASAVSIDSPNVYCAGTHNVVATIQNRGTTILDSVTVNWSVDGVTQTSVKYIGTLDTAGGSGSATVQVTLGSYNFSSSAYQVSVWTSQPNGVADTVNSNDTAHVTMQSNLPPPTALSLQAVGDTTATISWQVGSYANSWLYDYWPAGNYPSGAGTSVSADSVSLTGLVRATTYDFYVREVCPTGDTSNWAGPLTFTTPCSSPLNGTYTINPNQAVSNSNFASFSDALAALNSCGVSGAVTFNVAANSGPYVAGVELTAISGASASNTVTFNGNGNVVNEGSAAYFIALNGVSYLTIKDFRFVNTNPAIPKFGIMLRGASRYINITNNHINVGTVSTSTASAGIAVSNSLTLATTAGNNGQYITITGNEIVGGYYGVTLIGQASYADNYGHIVSGNTVRDFYQAGIYLVNADTVIVEKNNISRNNRTTLTTFYGTYLSTSRNVKIRQNEIHSSGVGSYTANPIYITTSVNSAGYETEIINNLIHNIPTTSTSYAIYGLGTRDHIKVYHNTVDLNTSGAGATRAIFFSTAPNNHDLKNNILSVRGAGTGAKFLIYITTTSTTFTSNYNVLFMGATAGTNNVGYWTANRSTLALWQSNSGQDGSSSDVNPHFSNSLDGNLIPLNVAIDNIGTPVGVSTDIWDSTRSNSTPDIGAIEFIGVSGDIALVSAKLAKNSFCYNTNDTAEFVITNVFGSTVDFSTYPLKLVWIVSGPVTSSDTITINSGTLNVDSLLVIKSYSVNTSRPGNYSLAVHILPNNVNPSAYNDSLLIPFEFAIKEIFNIAPKASTMGSFSDSLLLLANSPLFTTSGGITTSWLSNNGSGGNYFDITVNNKLLLTGFEVNNSSTGTASYQVYYRSGSYVGYNGASSGWVSLGAYNVSAAGQDNPTVITLAEPLALLSGTYALYIVATSGNHQYINGTTVGNTWASNADLTIYEGIGTDNIVFSSTAFSPRNFSGRIRYAVPSELVTGLTWKEGSTVIDSTLGIYVGPYTTHGTYTYVATYNNVCGTFTDTAIVIMPPRVDMAAEKIILPPASCQLDSLPVHVRITNASLIEAIDFSQDTVTVEVAVTGGVNQVFKVILTDNMLNNNQPLDKGSSIIVPLGYLQLNNSGTYYFNASVSVTDDGNSANDGLPVDSIEVNPTPVVNAGQDQFVCSGDMVSLNGSATNGSSFMYSWSPDAALNDASSANPSFTALANQMFTLTVSNVEGCMSSDMVNVLISDVSANAGSDYQVCSGSPTLIGANNAAGGSYGPFTYNWSNGSFLSDSTIKNPEATVSANTTFVLTVTDSLGCMAMDSMLIEALAVPSPVVSGKDSVCETHSATYSTPSNAGTTYLWQVNGGTISGSSTGTSVNIVWGSSGTGIVKVTQTITAGGCFASTPDYTVVKLPKPNATIFPITSTTVCQGESVTLVTISATGVSYQWTRNGSAIQGATSSVYYATQSGSYKLFATSAQGCVDSSSAISVVVNPSPAATITPSGSTTICDGQSVTLNANTGTNLSYTWLRNNVTIVSATSSSYIASTSGDYEVIVTDSNNCETNSSAVTVTVNSLPSASASALSSTTFCQGGSVTLSAFSATGYTYQWKLSGVNITNATLSTLNVTASGTYTVEVTSSQGCKATSSGITVTVNSLPTATATASGSTTFCSGGSVVINANTGTGLSYQWIKDGSNMSGATSSSITATQSGSYTVKVTSQNGCTNTSSAIQVTVNTVPIVAISAVGNTTICEGDEVSMFSVSFDASTYQWLRNGSVVSNATSSNYSAPVAGQYRLVAYSSQGCSDTSNSVSVTVNPLPDTSITVTGVKAFCEGGSVTLSANKTTGATYQWQRNAANIFNATSSSYTANTSGDYRLVITDNVTGCANMSSAVSVNVLAGPDAVFMATNVCSGDSMMFNNASTGSTLSYLWSFGDGNSSTDQSPSYLYGSEGNYNVKLVVTSSDGCMDSVTHMVEVYPKPMVNFTISNACEGSAAAFASTSTISGGSIASYDWSFGDNTTGSSANTTHVYPAPGPYAVTLRVTSLRSCVAEKTDTVVISPNPVVSFTADNNCMGNDITFNNNSIVSSGTMNYMWTFGDGNTSTVAMPVHSFSAAGTYSVSLTVTTDMSCMASETRNVEVYPVPAVNFTANGVCIGQPTEFVNATTVSMGALTYTWNFGNGDTSNVINPVYTFASAGTHQVMLMATTEEGCMDSILVPVQVYDMPNTGWTSIHGFMGEVAFTANEQNANNYIWHFGDGDSSLMMNPVHMYDSNGTYTVTLTVNTVNGCTSSTTDTVQIINTSIDGDKDAPSISFDVYPNPFNVNTNLVYDLPKASIVTLEVFDMNGKRVSRLVNTHQLSGKYLVPVSADEHGLRQGVYLVRLTVDGHSYVKRIVQVK